MYHILAVLLQSDTFSLFLSIFYISQRLTLWYFVFLYLIFLSQQVLYFLLSTLVLTLYIDVVLSLSILKVMAEWPWRYKSRSKVTVCDTPSHRAANPSANPSGTLQKFFRDIHKISGTFFHDNFMGQIRILHFENMLPPFAKLHLSTQ